MKSNILLCVTNPSFKSCFALFLLVVVSTMMMCCKEQSKPIERILVRIGEKSISVDEFIRRAEYTIRPAYCNSNNNIHKKIVINSLIAEKMMAIEASDTNEVIMNNNVQEYLRGLKEQAMRRYQYEKEALQKVEFDSAQLARTYSVAGRNYEIAYFNFPDSSLVNKMATEIRANTTSFEDSYRAVTGRDTVPQRDVKFSVSEHDMVIDSLFSKPLQKNQVIGPLNVTKNQFLMMKVKGWTDTPAVTEPQVRDRRLTVLDYYKSRAAKKLYGQFIREVMKGKTIDFYPHAFYKVTNLLAPKYIITDEKRQAMFKNMAWDQNEEIQRNSDIKSQIEELYQEPFFTIAGNVWTVEDFAKELVVHPLVFSNTKIRKDQFGQQLQLAIIDMVRDRYLTQEAYKKGYDNVMVVERIVNMWKDNLNYYYYKSQLLKQAGADTLTDMHYIDVIEKYLNATVDTLQNKYSNIIEIDVDAFNKIELTRIDMHVVQKYVPFPKAVPSFPLVTTDNKLDYGQKMEKE